MSATAVARKSRFEGRVLITPPRIRAMTEARREKARAVQRTAFADWIETIGEARLAAICGMAEITPFVWKHMGYVPRAKWPELLIALEDEGLTLRDLLRLEAEYQTKRPK